MIPGRYKISLQNKSTFLSDYIVIGIQKRPEKKDYIEAGPLPPPLEAILVIFGRRALIFFLFESSWEKMKNDTTFVRMRSSDHLGDAKMSKKGTSLP